MDNQRVFVWAALALVLWLNYLAWERDYSPAPVAALPTQATTTSETPAATKKDSLPELPTEPQAASTSEPTASTAAAPAEATAQVETIRVKTDVLNIDISTRGGDLIRADLLQYPREKNKPNEPVRLFNPTAPGYFVARSGLRAAGERTKSPRT